MQLIPYVGEEPMRSDAFSIVVSQEDTHRVTRMLMRCAAVTGVVDKQSFETAKTTAGQLKALLDEIQDAKRAAKRPFSAVEQAIENKAQSIAEGLTMEFKRIGHLMNAYIAQLEAQAKAETLRREEQLRAEKERLEKIAAEARAAQKAAEEQARKAKDELELAVARERAKQLEQARIDAELDQALALDLADLGKRPAKPLVTGGRVDHPYKFKVTDIYKVVVSGHVRCIRWEVDVLACKDVIRAQLERGEAPRIPGIEITQETSVHVRASA